MKLLIGPRDTIVRWVALTIVVAMCTTVMLNILFTEFAGVWAQPSLKRAGLLEQVAAITRVLNAAPAGERTELARAASNPAYNVAWWLNKNGMKLPSEEGTTLHDGALLIQTLTNSAQRRVQAFSPDDWPAGSRDRRYMVLVQLDDATWLSFTTPVRSWGLNTGWRISVVVSFGLVTALLVAWVATRRLATPLKRFAQAAKRLGGDLHAPAIEPEGPHEIRQAIIAFNAMQAQIQHYVADRSQMLAAISHDLRSPLTRMRLRGEFIDDPEQQRKLFRDVDDMQSMITAALAFFRDEARLEPATAFDLAELIQTLLDDYRDQGVTVNFTGPPRLTFHGRPLGIKRAITNLIDNAHKYAEVISIELTEDNGTLSVRILDRGPGIPDAMLEKVFDPFQRLETSRNRDTGGVGLGLSSARAIVLEHGGHLSLRNREGGGLSARVVLPV